MKIAVLGAGRMGLLHARLLREVAAAEELLVADVEPGRARTAADELGALAYTDPIAALDRADAAVIATPPATHAELVRAAVERGCPVLCEKPLAEDLSGAIDLARYVEAAGILVQVGFQRRFDPGYQTARALIQDGRLGKLFLMRLHGTEPIRPRSNRTNLLRNTAIHDFDLIRWLSGSEVESVYVEGSDRDGGPFDPLLDPDTIAATLRLADGSLAAVTLTRLSPLGYDVRTELVGSRDHVVLGWSSRTPVRPLEPDARWLGSGTWKTWQARFEQAYRNELEAFLRATRGTGPSAATVWDGVAAQRIAEAARRSLEEGRKIVLTALPSSDAISCPPSRPAYGP